MERNFEGSQNQASINLIRQLATYFVPNLLICADIGAFERV